MKSEHSDGRAAVFELVEEALQAATRQHGSGPGFQIGVCDGSGAVIAGVLLQTYAQVDTFSRVLGNAGYMCILGEPPQAMAGCDMLLVPPAPMGPDFLEP